MNNNLYTNKNVKAMNRKYNKELKNSCFNKNIISINYRKKSFIEFIIKFFIKIIMLIAVSKTVNKNKTKMDELVNRVYKRFTGKDFAFIPISFAFYLLISFIPIVMSVYVMLNLLPINLKTLFKEEVLQKIIPGLESFIDSMPKTWDTGTYAVIIPLFLASLWVSSGGFSKFIYSINYIYRHETTGNWFINRLKGFIVVLCITVFIFLSMFIYLSFFKMINMDKASETNKNIYFYIVFSIYLMANLYSGFSILLKFTPAFKISWSLVTPGVLIASVPTMIFVTIFGYLTSLINYNKFGIFGVFMYIALLVSNMAYFIYLGIIANEAYYKTFHSRYTISKKIWFKKFL
ncbi:YihY/virulence factor BrkB family protein [Mycoplasmopsis primatum]|uniref:YihY/virulence factor BrkB family protein n=1 Tax=Mycoplasmopsis primatum TaxID=55604 RepID=UPI000495D990|nr:YhjD/YihY/BrkB family envelope integrity protein [Mycoplasmopsis primatum]